ncbi:MAG: fumarate reductase/succinate dehydrogenase flavoprotein subunit, partial [Planctomycetota bacterium]|nr:fumarate reductase/succinate dehydrogenase flavoprotein subunit [Planctomycetota bacterium]
HGANRLGASALMQGLADGYFVIPATLAGHLVGRPLPPVETSHEAFGAAEDQVRERTKLLLSINGPRSVDSLHRELGLVMWEHVGMGRTAAGLTQALERIVAIRESFWSEVRVTGEGQDLNATLEHAGRLADFLEFAEVMAADALRREESCGGHFREEHQTPEGEALRDDENFSHVAAWEHTGDGQAEACHLEQLTFDEVKLATRSYK